METKQCKCGTSFNITDTDMEFYDKISPIFAGKKYSILAPTFCPDCRQQRRMAWRNERKLYKRKCDLTGKDIISTYSPISKYKVYEQNIWRSDQWDPLEYGRNYDFDKSFFDQFSDLFVQTPKISNLVRTSTNCEYNVIMGNCKNCYMCSTTFQSEDCLYDCWCVESNKCVDCYDINVSENSYECFDVFKGYNLHFSESCKECSDSYFLFDCVGCKNCFLSTGLRNKQYCFENEQFSQEEYNNKINKILPLTNNKINDLKKRFNELKIKQIRKYYTGQETTNSEGDYLTNCSNCLSSFNLVDGEDVKYGRDSAVGVKDCMDVSMIGDVVNLMLEAHASGYNGYKSAFVNLCWTNSELFYCDHCMYCQNCFGCVGLKNKSYCILNKQYYKSEYEKLVPKIIEKMKSDPATGDGAGAERGEFFPSSISPFGYNETIAQEDFPLTKEEAIKEGFKRSDYEVPFPKVDKTIKAEEIPDDITKISDDILNQAVECEVSGKPFKIIKPELDFYRSHNLPLPHKHPEVRYMERMKLRNPRKLWDRKCMKCEKDIKTSYSPERKEIIYCEQCYNKEIYG